MSTSNLPATLVQVSGTMKSAATKAHLGIWQETITAGYLLIEMMYDPHPIKRPLDVVRQRAARQWWEQKVRETSKELAVAMLNANMNYMKEMLDQPTRQAKADFDERNRRKQVHFNADEQIRVAKETAKAQAQAQLRLDRGRARLNPPSPIIDPQTAIRETIAEIAKIEQDQTLTEEQRRRRLAIQNRALDQLLIAGRR